MTPTPTTAAPDPRREEELRIQALGAALSRRKWSEVEEAYDKICDEFYRRPRAMQEAMPAQGGGEPTPKQLRDAYAYSDLICPTTHNIEAEMLGVWRFLNGQVARPAPEVKDAAGFERCADCGGSGMYWTGEDVRPCPECKGDTVVPTPAPAASDELVERLRLRAKMPPDYYKTTFDIEEAATRIEADAAEMERKDAALLKAFEYIGGARGTALALAMSGPDNPKLDSGLMKLHDDGLRVEQEARAALRPEAKGGREDVG